MSTAAAQAFGRYMRRLRERRGLSTLAVSRLFEGTPERVDRGSLWRLENGEHSLSMGKLTSLGRIYGVLPEVLAERLELDRELAYLDLPETGRLTPGELFEAGRRALVGEGSKWWAYACFRDGLDRADPAQPRIAEWLNLGTAIRSLGKNRLALHELTNLEPCARDHELYPVLLDRIANCNRCLGDLTQATRWATLALREAGRRNDTRITSVILSTLANIAMARGEYATCITHLNDALAASCNPESANGALRPSPGFEVTLLNMMAECELLADNPGSARTAAKRARKIAGRYELELGVAGSELLLGQIDEREGRDAEADVRWKRVAAMADRLHHRRLAFAAEFYRFRRARRIGAEATATASRRRLERLLPWVPAHVPVVAEFWSLIAKETSAERRSEEPRGGK